MTIKQLIKWYSEVTLVSFGRTIYGKDEHESYYDGYTKSKYMLMQKSPIEWMATLDSHNRTKLEQLIKEM